MFPPNKSHNLAVLFPIFSMIYLTVGSHADKLNKVL